RPRSQASTRGSRRAVSPAVRPASWGRAAQNSSVGGGPGSPAAPCTYTAATAASAGEAPCAIRPPTAPASTSPEPPDASPAVPVLLMKTRPDGSATTVGDPFNTTTACHARAYVSANSTGRAVTSAAGTPHSRAISPGCGVSTRAGASSAPPAGNSWACPGADGPPPPGPPALGST